nr:11666_t:CDS:10 [Entrophospora candida]
MSQYKFETLKVNFPLENVIHVELSRPSKLNAINNLTWIEIGKCFSTIKTDPDIRAVVISGAGKLFTAGIDVNSLGSTLTIDKPDAARKAITTRNTLLLFQESITAIETCYKPVIAAIHNACIGIGVTLITACDIRYCSQDAFFNEVDLGLAADVGTLQRLPKVIANDSLVRELCYTCRNMFADEALSAGLVNKEAMNVAKTIASKSPVAIMSTKHLLNYSRDHSVAEGLEYTSVWNGSMLDTKDVTDSINGFMTKTKPIYSKL